MSNVNSETELHSKQIDFSGIQFSFSIPENFSPDMPAEDMITSLNIVDGFLNSDDTKAVLRRFWDIYRKPGLFTKNTGTLMLAIQARSVDDEYSLNARIQLVNAVQDNLTKQYEQHNIDAMQRGEEAFMVLLPAIQHNYQDKVLNGQRWLNTVTETHHKITHLYILPLNDSVYLEVNFTFMPNDNQGLREFVLDVASKEVSNIIATLKLKYPVDSPVMDSIDADKNTIDIQQVIQQKL